MGKGRRCIAGFLAVILTAVTIFTAMPPLITYAAATARPRNQLWRGSDVTVLGHWRPTLYRWYNANDGKDLFCISQGKYMLENTVLDERQCRLGETVPMVDTPAQFSCMAGICDWYEKGAQTDVRYAVGQFAVWAVMEGYYGDMSAADGDMNIIAGHIKGNFLEQWGQLKAYLQTSGGLPSWAGSVSEAAPYQNMQLEDGAYRLKLDISSCPKLAGAAWKFPGPGWEKSVDGTSLIFTYRGSQIPEGVLSADISAIPELSWKNGGAFTLYSTSDPTFQLMINGMDTSGGLYVRIGGTSGEDNASQVKIFRHQETFEAHYKVELDKLCAETGKGLQGAVFEVSEEFDEEDLGDLRSSEMIPYFRGSRICQTVTTDDMGHGSHKDMKSYAYSRTYCMGHPEPDYLDVPEGETDEETGETTNEEEIAYAEEENERLRQTYESQIEECSNTVDFHDIDGGGMEQMLADRDNLYDQFIHLSYVYTLSEISARNGYILHGIHPDDREIEKVRIASSEAGTAAERSLAADFESGLEEDADSIDKDIEEKEQFGFPEKWKRGARQLSFPETDNRQLDELRAIEYSENDEETEDKGWEDENEEGACENIKDKEDKTDHTDMSDTADKNGGTDRELNADEIEDADSEGKTQGEEGRIFLQGMKAFAAGGWDGQKKEERKDPDTIKSSGNTQSHEIRDELGKIMKSVIAEVTDEMDKQELIGETGAVAGEESGTGKETVTGEEPGTGEETGIGEESGTGEETVTEKTGSSEETERADKPTAAGGSGAAELPISQETADYPSKNSSQSVCDTYTLFQRQQDSAILWEYMPQDPVWLSTEQEAVYLLPPTDDHIPGISHGEPGRTGHIFRVEDHRTEGEVHINKRDKDLYEKDSLNSYGKTQGDATLEGAVYGLYAAEPIVHPDGRTGIVFAAGDLVSTGTTDEEGNASFLVVTENSTASTNASNLDGTWIGHPLLLGRYVVREIARSEGYELSVTGKEQSDTNRLAQTIADIQEPGAVEVVSGLRHPVENYDGSWNEFQIRSGYAPEGYDIIVHGYPEGSQFYRVEQKTEIMMEDTITRWILQPEKDALGNVVYETARGGERKTGADGNYIRALDPETGEALWDMDRPVSETYVWIKRSGYYPSGTAVPQHPERWNSSLDTSASYVEQEANAMLRQLGYKMLSGESVRSPWYFVPLSGETSGEVVTEILDWYTLHSFYDCGGVDAILEREGKWYARVFADYSLQNVNTVLETRTGLLYVKKQMELEGGKQGYYWIAYDAGSYEAAANTATVFEKKEIPVRTPVVWGEEYADFIETVYEPLYEVYQEGEVLTGADGLPVAVMKTVPVYELTTREQTKNMLMPVHAERKADGTYLIHDEGRTPEETTQGESIITYRASAPERFITIDGETVAYGDYLVQTAGAGVSISLPQKPGNEDSYEVGIQLVYPGQYMVFQDQNTRKNPAVVLERVIRQAVRVTKDIAQESYDEINTYRIHRDPFTVLFGGYLGKPGAKAVKGFTFRLYRKTVLEETGELKLKEDGKGPDYTGFFEEHPDAVTGLAVSWDHPVRDLDGDMTTIHAALGSGKDDYYGVSIPLPYGVYVLVEQQPEEIPGKHYEVDLPQEIGIPFAPDIEEGVLWENRPSSDYIYHSDWTPEKMVEKFGIRFNEENTVIQAHNHDGDFLVYPYGILAESGQNSQNAEVEQYYHYGKSELSGVMDHVYYDRYYDSEGNVTDYGITLDHVPVMTGVSTAIDGQYARALVPWSMMEPDEGQLHPGIDRDGKFNFAVYANADMENRLYHTRIRIEKLDSMTKEPILHDGALFKIFAARRSITGGGENGVQGTGSVVFKHETVTGGREELEELGYVEHISWDEVQNTYTGQVAIPDYDPSEQIIMKDNTGNETGIFKAYSTVREVVTEEGKTEKLTVGYIETYEPLGTGVYVLVEVEPPTGYQVSRPVAFEVYSDHVTYYEGGWSEQPVEALEYQYEIPVTGEDDKYGKMEVQQIKVEDIPSRLKICKVEDGDRMVGDINGLDGLTGVNDTGDMLTYVVKGTKEYLKARGDVTDILWNEKEKIYSGKVKKVFNQYGETLLPGKEEDFVSREDRKPLYRLDGSFSGYGIEFSIPVSGAGLTLYQGVPVTRLEDGSWAGVSVLRNSNGRVTQITAGETGRHLELVKTGKDSGAAHEDIWDTESRANEERPLYFYQMDTVTAEYEEKTDEWYVLDDRGNRICLVDPSNGMAYAYDEEHRAVAYAADSHGQKEAVQSIAVHETEDGRHVLYQDIDAVTDEQGLPVYYRNWTLNGQEEQWITDQNGSHTIYRLPFGAYILEESSVPYKDGYVKSCAQGIRFRKSGEEQRFFYQNVFTKIDISKVDITTGKEVRDAGLCLYEAGKEECSASWTSGYKYDDDGLLERTDDGKPVLWDGSHWIDHIPPGDYVLKETKVPYQWGYVDREALPITIKETGDVQTFVMENDYTSIEVIKQDADTKHVMPEDNPAELSLYPAVTGADGKPVFLDKTKGETRLPVWREEEKLVSWKTGDGKSIAAAGKVITDEYGSVKTVYPYEKHQVKQSAAVKQAVYYITETGSTRFDYLPVGFYVLVETGTPAGYATAQPVLIEVKNVGHDSLIQKYTMDDVPLKTDIAKIVSSKHDDSTEPGQDGEKAWDRDLTIKGAKLGLYEVYDDGSRSAKALYNWVSGEDGRGLPHRLVRIPVGNYVLIEEETPYGLVKADDLYITVEDTPDIQTAVMEDRIQEGSLVIMKHEADKKDVPLKGAAFQLKNKESGKVLETVITDSEGTAKTGFYPIGYMDETGVWKPYTYTVTETAAPDGYLVNPVPYEFEFVYAGEKTYTTVHKYDASDQLNQIKIIKQSAASGENLEGAELALVNKATGEVVEQWVTTVQPHYINGISQGKYVLRELRTPGPGFAKAEDQEIEVTDHMAEPVVMVMKDESTVIEVKKTDATGKLLPGARLCLTGPDGTVVKEWTSENSPVYFYGLAPGIYLLSEISAPSGYEKGQPMKVKVTDEAVSKYEYQNYRIHTGGGSDQEKKEEPDKPKGVLGERIGTITASYEPAPVTGRRLTENGNGVKGHRNIRTGDDTVILPYAAALLFCMAAWGILERYRRKGKKKKG